MTIYTVGIESVPTFNILSMNIFALFSFVTDFYLFIYLSLVPSLYTFILFRSVLQFKSAYFALENLHNTASMVSNK